MSFGSLGRRSGLSSYNPRLSATSSSKPSSASSRISLATASPISRSLTSLSYGQSPSVDQYIQSAAASATAYNSNFSSHRRNPHGRRTSHHQQPSSISSRLRSSSQNNLNSIGSQTYVTPVSQTRSSRIIRPVSNASSLSSLNSFKSSSNRNITDSETDAISSASSLNSLASFGAADNNNKTKSTDNLYKSSLATNNNTTTSNGSSNNNNNINYDNYDINDRLTNSTNITSDEIDYKKLCKQLLRENEILRRRIKELEETEKKREQEFGREKRSLQRTISEMEEELKSMNDIKADNMRLKDENAALIRVISKLSKN